MTSRTRSGTHFKKTINEATARSTEHGSTEMAETSELAGMLKALLDDRKALETELREERRVRAEETARRDQETAPRRQEQRGSDGLASRYRGRRVRGEGGGDRRPPTHDPKVQVAKPDDIEA